MCCTVICVVSIVAVVLTSGRYFVFLLVGGFISCFLFISFCLFVVAVGGGDGSVVVVLYWWLFWLFYCLTVQRPV